MIKNESDVKIDLTKAKKQLQAGFKDIISEEVKVINKKKEENKEEPFYKGLILFFSIDIVNSTLYKTINYYSWVDVLDKIFDILRKAVRDAIPEPESALWRVHGDEVIFIIKIADDEALKSNFKMLNEIFIKYREMVKSGNIFDEIYGKSSENCNKDVEFLKLQNILSLKATSWIAMVTHSKDLIGNEKFDEYENILKIYKQSEKNHQFFEFLGNDIDAGFRLAKEAYDGRHIISFELAYLLADQTEHMKNIYIITYKHLKGIWKDRLYPIIWYYDEKMNNKVAFSDSFAYDEFDRGEIVKEYFDNLKGKNETIRDLEMFKNTYYALHKIGSDNRLNSKIDRMYKLIKTTNNLKSDIIEEEILKLYYIAVCVDNKERKVMIAKRNSELKDNPGVWEFGVCKAIASKNIVESLIDNYKNVFNLDISIVLDDDREEQQPIPIALYEKKKKLEQEENKSDGTGIITLAIVEKPQELQNKIKNKYVEVRWISEKQLESFNEAKVIDFDDTVKKVFKKIDEIKGKSGDE